MELSKNFFFVVVVIFSLWNRNDQ